MAATQNSERRPWTVSLAQAFLLLTCVLGVLGVIVSLSRGSAGIAALGSVGSIWAALAIIGLQRKQAWGWWLGIALSAYSIVAIFLGLGFSLGGFIVLLLLLDGRSRRYALMRQPPPA